MPPQNSQAPQLQMQPNDAAASLAMATHISTQLATPQQPAPQEALQAPPEAETPTDPEVAAKNDKVLTEIQGLRDDLQTLVAPKPVEQEIADIRQQLEALKNEPER